MAGAAGPNTVESGLVFAYDLGNIITSYIGEPTTNLVLDPDGNANIITTDVPFGTGVIGYAQYSSGYYVNPRSTTPTSATGNTFTYSVYMRSQTSPSSTYLMYVYTGTGPDGGWYYFGDGALTSDWKKYTYSRNDMTGTVSTVTVYRYNQQGTIDISAPQIELKTHATQFTKGTRSATQGLLNLGGSDTINITNASFNDNAQLVFDGTNDYVYLTSFNPTFTTGITMECIAKWTTNPGGSWQRMFDFGNGSNADNLIFCRYSNGDQLFFGIYNGSGNSYNVTGGGAILFGQYAHYVAVADGTDFKVYVNGQLIFSGANNTIPVTTPRTNNYIGKSNWADSYFDGEIPVSKIYTKALTAAEVLQNYQALRYRFGI